MLRTADGRLDEDCLAAWIRFSIRKLSDRRSARYMSVLGAAPPRPRRDGCDFPALDHRARLLPRLEPFQ